MWTLPIPSQSLSSTNGTAGEVLIIIFIPAFIFVLIIIHVMTSVWRLSWPGVLDVKDNHPLFELLVKKDGHGVGG